MFRRKLVSYGHWHVWPRRLTNHPSLRTLSSHNGFNSNSNNRRLLQHQNQHLQKQIFEPYYVQQQQQQQRYFSDKLLGHSPMAPASATATNSEESGIPTARDVEIAGGIWNPTSAKRDRLAELKVELTEDQYTLDDAATDQQKRDLYLADGIQWIVHTADTCRGGSSTSSTADASTTQLPSQLDPSQWDVEPTIAEVQSWIQEQENTIKSTTDGGMLNQQQWETYLEEMIQKIDEQMVTLPSGRYLPRVRDFYTVPDDIINKDSSGGSSSSSSKEEEKDVAEASMTKQQVQAILNDNIATSSEQEQLQSIGNKCLARYRLQLAKATCEYMIESWGTLTTLTDEALDRLAVKNDTDASTESATATGSSIDNNNKDDDDGRTLTTLSLDKANKILRSCLVGDATDRFDSWWEMLDHNGDGLLEKTDMETAATSTVTPVQNAIVILYDEALEASLVLMRKGKAQEAESDDAEEDTTTTNPPKPKANPGWLERRRETKAKKRLRSTFQRATKKHFLDEVEMPHRLRCIYAWANKDHQDNKIDSVLIEASGWSGRKRYVELQPKISLPEFREVQAIHFTHLDRIGWEITKSFREDLLVEQGKGRQNAELKRDCMIFLLVVSLIDYGILIL